MQRTETSTIKQSSFILNLSSNKTFLAALFVFLVFSSLSKSFLTLTNIFGIMHASVPLIFVSIGLAIVVTTHNLDISVGSVAFLSSVIGAVLLVRYGLPPWISAMASLATGYIAGLSNAFLVTKFRISSFIATLGTMMVFRGIGLQIVKGRTISIPNYLGYLASSKTGGFYWDILFSFLIIFVMHTINRKTPFGRYIAAIGSNAEICRRAGINVEKVTRNAFILSGVFASLGGLWLSLQLGVVSLRMGVGMEFAALAGVVIGGISLFGGEGSLLPGLLLGIYTLYMIESGLNHLGVSPYAYPFVRGGLIFFAMYMDSLRARLTGKRGTLFVREER
ncbi:MAG: ABC transporter permease [Candidatus Caldatribacteriaceae bacterium]